MRFSIRLLIPGLVLVTLPALAQTVAPTPAVPPPTNGRLTDAPMPNVVPEQIAPSARAGSVDSGPSNSTPFSGIPSSNSSNGSLSPTDRSGGTPGGSTLPNLSR